MMVRPGSAGKFLSAVETGLRGSLPPDTQGLRLGRQTQRPGVLDPACPLWDADPQFDQPAEALFGNHSPRLSPHQKSGGRGNHWGSSSSISSKQGKPPTKKVDREKSRFYYRPQQWVYPMPREIRSSWMLGPSTHSMVSRRNPLPRCAWPWLVVALPFRRTARPILPGGCPTSSFSR